MPKKLRTDEINGDACMSGTSIRADRRRHSRLHSSLRRYAAHELDQSKLTRSSNLGLLTTSSGATQCASTSGRPNRRSVS